MSNYSPTVGTLGFGHFGLLLAITFGKKYQTIGYTLNRDTTRIKAANMSPFSENL